MAEERGDCNREMTVFLVLVLPAANFALEAWKCDGEAWKRDGPKRSRSQLRAQIRYAPPGIALLLPAIANGKPLRTFLELLRQPCPKATVGRKRHHSSWTA
jgi:hypothetical protein